MRVRHLLHILAISLALSISVAGCTGGDDDDGLGELDPRCESLCADSDAACVEDVAECEDLCQVRIAGVSSVCATCLLEDAHGGTCPGGETCCPDPEFPNGVLDCAAVCEGSAGVNPSGNHPVCVAICADGDPACETDVTLCLEECQARISGVSGICATCLLEGANGGPCLGGETCCPDPEFPTSTTECAAFCAG